MVKEGANAKTGKSQNELWKYLQNKRFQHFANALIPPSECVAVLFLVERRYKTQALRSEKPALRPPKDAKRR